MEDAARLILAVSLGLSILAQAVGAVGVCENVFPRALDVGIYWARLDSPTGTLVWDKSCIAPEPAISTSFYPARKTLIMTHGLQPDFTRKELRMWAESETMQFAAPWVQQGWNVGIFQWTQFADKMLSHFERAEAQIWTPNYYTNMAFVYADAHGNIKVADAPNDASVARLFVKHYLAHAEMMSPGTEVRIVGHSLGSQLVALTSYLLYTEHGDGSAVLPGRVAMLDPVYSPTRKGYLLDGNHYRTGFDADDAGTVQSMLTTITSYLHAHGVAVEVYKFSYINRCVFSSQADAGIFAHTAFAQPTVYTWGDRHLGKCYSPGLFSTPTYSAIKKKVDDVTEQMKNQHIIALPWYLTSLVAPPRKCVLQNAGTDAEVCLPMRGHALSAAMSTEEVLAHIDSGGHDSARCYHQYDNGSREPDAPVMTPFSDDDTFYLHPCKTSNT